MVGARLIQVIDHLYPMKTKDLEVRTSARTEMLNLTSSISAAVEDSGVEEGICLIHIPHTTAAVIVNEGWDPAVMDDISDYLDERVPWRAGYKHSEGNSAAHIKASLLGNAALLPVSGGKLALGRWQAVFFCEFDGPRARKVQIGMIEG
jgi:secondary thiamine-phosphate synthase enzyme